MRSEKVVAALLNADAAVAAIAGSKVFGGAVPQDTTAPLVVYLHASSSAANAQRAQQSNTWVGTIDVLCVAATYAQLKDLAEAVRAALVFRSGVIAGVQVAVIVCSSKGRDAYDAELDEYGQVISFNITYQE